MIGPHDLLVAHHLADVEAHEHHVPQAPGAHGVPGVKNIVMTEGDVDPRLPQFLHPCDPPALGVGIHPPLKVGIDQGVGDKVDPAHFEKPHEADHIGVIIGMHGGGVAGGDLVV